MPLGTRRRRSEPGASRCGSSEQTGVVTKPKKKAAPPKASRVEWPKHGIRTAGMPTTASGAVDGFRYIIDPSEQQVIDNRGGRD